MSTIESAYLKAKKQKGDKDFSSEDELSPGRSFASPESREAHELVSSRKEISKMKQESAYTSEELSKRRLIYATMSDTILLNSYRNLRTKLLATSESNNFLTLVTSVTPNGGSSLVAANLASTFAFDEGKTSLLIDANIHHPVLNSLLEVDVDKGLIDFLEAEDWDGSEIIYDTRIPRLRLIPSGLVRENSAEYFTSKKMKQFIEQLVSRYPDRYPIIDAPSITFSADTRILVDLCERVILVVPYGQCTEEEVKSAAKAIGREKLAGIVLNQF
ncbi:polysaccharide biosynthesis protein [Aliikangiella sp. IMCC44359]|uniref:polysaccharide biosynthesis protein n=1 Tax=Aliikangiella sp. IMCC44359 TaxID=3459125 RepID=UPI00403AF959